MLVVCRTNSKINYFLFAINVNNGYNKNVNITLFLGGLLLL